VVAYVTLCRIRFSQSVKSMDMKNDDNHEVDSGSDEEMVCSFS
jgi:hypothetical protein